MPADNRAKFEAIFAVFNTGDLSQADALLAPDYRDHDLPAAALSGHATFRFMITAVRKAFPDLKATILETVAEGDLVAARTRLSGTHRGDFAGIPGTDKPFSIEEQHLFRFVDGLAVEHWSVRDKLDFLTQVGILPGMSAADVSEWSYVGPAWPARNPRGDGWNDDSVAEVQERHWALLLKLVEGPGPLGVSHLPTHRTREDPLDQNIVMSFAYVLALAARKKDRVSILDWGGGIGHYYLYTKALLPEVEIDYHCFEVPRLSELGKKLLPEAHFHDDPTTLAGKRFDLVLASSSLHYFQDWRDTLRLLVARTDGLLYVSRLQTVARESSYVVAQRPHSAGYMTRYLSWFINRGEFRECLSECGADLLREFVFAENWPVVGAPEKGESWGFLARRRG